MSEPTDLRDNNKSFRLFERFSQEANVISVARFTGLCAVLASLMALFAWNDAKEARVLVETELRILRADIHERNEHQAYLEALWVALRADLEAQGYKFEGGEYVGGKVQEPDRLQRGTTGSGPQRSSSDR
jgi:hypothetical protein